MYIKKGRLKLESPVIETVDHVISLCSINQPGCPLTKTKNSVSITAKASMSTPVEVPLSKICHCFHGLKKERAKGCVVVVFQRSHCG